MKKVIAVVFVLCLFYGNFSYVDLDSFKSTTKTIEVKGFVVNPRRI